LTLSSAGMTTASAQPSTTAPPTPLTRANPVLFGILGYNAATLTINGWHVPFQVN